MKRILLVLILGATAYAILKMRKALTFDNVELFTWVGGLKKLTECLTGWRYWVLWSCI